MKRGILLLLVLIVTAVLYSPASWADGTDPVTITQGCGAGTKTPCDATPLGESITLTFTSTGVIEAMASVVNGGSTPVGQFYVTFPSMYEGTTLSYSCGTAGVDGYGCTPEGDDTFLFTAPAVSDFLCPSPTTETTAGAVTQNCLGGETVILEATTTAEEELLAGATLVASTSISPPSVPEPASGLLLLLGLAAGGLTGLRRRLHI